MRYCTFLIAIFSSLNIFAQEFKLYSEIHWRPDQSWNSVTPEIRKVVGDSMGNTYVLYWADRDFRVKNSEFLCQNKITTIGATGTILKLDKEGNFVWGMALNGGYYSDIVCDKKGNLFVSGIGSTIPGHYLLAYLPGSSLMATDACNLLMKINPAGQLIWYSKDTMDLYDAFSRLWLDDKGNVYQYVMTNGSRRNEGHIEKFNTNGTRQWRSSLNYAFPHAVEVNRAGETYFSCFTYEIDKKTGRPSHPWKGDRLEMWKLDTEGKKSVVLSRKYQKQRQIDKWNKIEGDYFINQISFNADHTPVFWTKILMGHESGYIMIMGKRFEEKNGRFVFAEIGMDGQIISDLQLHTASITLQRDICNHRDVGIAKRVGGIYCGNRMWLFGAPVASLEATEDHPSVSREAHLAYITFNANERSAGIQQSPSTYVFNYEGVGFGYMGDSTLYTWGKRFDADIPPKPNYTFCWYYIERIQPREVKVNSYPVAEADTFIAEPAPFFPQEVASPQEPVAASEVTENPVQALLYPNPTGANSIFQFRMPDGTGESIPAALFIYDEQGKIIHNETFVANAGENKVEVPSQYFAMGTYTIKVIAGNMEFSKVLIRI